MIVVYNVFIVVCIGVASYGALGHVPPLEFARVHQFGNLCYIHLQWAVIEL